VPILIGTVFVTFRFKRKSLGKSGTQSEKKYSERLNSNA